MVSVQQTPTRSAFPTTSQALVFGWRFFTSNFWFVALSSAIAGVSFGLSTALITATYHDARDDIGRWLVVGVLVIALCLVQTVASLALCRRGLDYWDEVEGRAAPRSFSDGLKHAIEGAASRLLPYTGWVVLQVSAFLVVVAVGRLAADAASDGVAIVVLLAMVVAFVALTLLTAFYNLAAADGPGNPATRSMHVLRGHVWPVVATILLVSVISLVVSVPVSFVVMAITHDSFVDSMNAVTDSGLYAMVVGGIGMGIRVLMYRAVLPPAGASSASGSRR